MLLNMKKQGFQCDYLQKSWEKCVGKDEGKKGRRKKEGGEGDFEQQVDWSLKKKVTIWMFEVD